MAGEIVQFVKGSQRFAPDGTGGGTLTWKERVTRPGFRPAIRERSMRKDAMQFGPSASMTNDEAAAYGDSQEK